MKKTTLLLFVMLAFSWQINAQLTEDFESTPLTGWTLLQTESDDPGFVQTTAQFYSGGASFYHNDDNIAAESTSWMISPAYTVISGDELSFYYRHNYYPTYSVETGVWISTTSGDPIANPGDFTEIYDLDANGSEDAWSLYTQDFSAYVGETVYVAFKYVGDWADELYIDDFSIAPPPTCPVPTDLAAITLDEEAEISWVESGSATSWNVEYGITDFTQGTGTMVTGTTSNPLSITGLTISTTYDFYVQADCDASGGTGISTWAGPYSFTTAAGPPPANNTCAGAIVVPVGEGTCGADVTGSNLAATDSGEPAPSYGYYSGGDIWYSFTLPVAASEISIDVTVNEFSTAIATVYDTTMSCGSLNEVDNGTTYGPGVITITGLTGGDTYLLRLYDWGNDDFGDITFCIGTPPSCLPPSAGSASSITETSADLGWTEAGSATTWNLEWGTAPLTQGAGTMVTGTTTNPYALSGLTPTTDYEYYVQADCGGGDTSAWAGPYTFSTSGPAPANDECVDAEAISCGDTVSGSTEYATDSGNNASNDVWYVLAGTSEGDEITASLCGSGYDTYIRVFDACGGTQVAFNDDECSVQSEITFTSDGVATYYIMVEGYSSNNGDFDLAVSCVALSVQDFDNGIEFSYYPNPVNDNLTLKAQKDIENIAVYNMLGQEVLRTAPNAVNTEVNMSALQAGAYFVKVTIGDATETVKVIKK
ncbi:choice-of-anchor J domain-containing protein [Lacinutrix sp. C3R15]|uniref:T9SS-dependent choice-of-anchor J family protein n=1 Tax=Flavobacteriaceae TaxID=49546 RepID=UPI001C09C222|nr:MULTISPECIES: choice-of-anchor J domain-containing protein [Flavobacteriaceae]MBU2940613.1 choice-of-anchor J domain-containing protein [Lacinutrix sp. C3R15]MDO6623931.1 choice-of-anchor J domain-containing protein [Oceanihabitans sp. 1_MG-2023]